MERPKKQSKTGDTGEQTVGAPGFEGGKEIESSAQSVDVDDLRPGGLKWTNIILSKENGRLGRRVKDLERITRQYYQDIRVLKGKDIAEQEYWESKVAREFNVDDEVILWRKPERKGTGFDDRDEWCHDFDVWTVLGPSTTKSDHYVLRNSYTDEEEHEQPATNMVLAPPLLTKNGPSIYLNGELVDLRAVYFYDMEEGTIEQVRFDVQLSNTALEVRDRTPPPRKSV
ncbi:uncharacterized protein AB675_4783 [Cyphellophora attinorum]|uniref:Uncharacterized protein n=1 Tax=Cyphellophora attinorum TaxID=1664694 RepID=A0A0N0NID0_9EURO|nr:uncharacterized protein AB675_4783 [Phialophora attinorum]KPI35598.1 hypothetical protein AB675_4783 [Phialophora attinorum]